MSLLLSEGHTAARHYPLGVLWTEIKIARRRINSAHVTGSLLMQACIGSVLGGKSGATAYNKLIKELSNG